MTEKEKNEPDLLSIVDRLVNNISTTNKANTDILQSVNISLTKVSEALPELKTISNKVHDLDTNTVLNEMRNISVNLKVLVAIIGIILTLGITILTLSQSKFESSVIGGVSTKVERLFDDKLTDIEKEIKILEDNRKR